MSLIYPTLLPFCCTEYYPNSASVARSVARANILVVIKLITHKEFQALNFLHSYLKFLVADSSRKGIDY